MKHKKIDWELIEMEFRSGQLSIREIARQHGCGESTIRKTMKVNGVVRDLSQRVAEKVRTELVRGMRTATPETEQEIIDTAAARAVEVVRSHRIRIKTGSIVVEKLFAQLEEVIDNREEIEEAIEIETADDKDPNRRNMMLRAVSLQANASTTVSLSASLKNLIGLDRLAFNLSHVIEADSHSRINTAIPQIIQDMISR